MADAPFWDEAEFIDAQVDLTVLAIGDSWFWYLDNNILTPLNRLINNAGKIDCHMLVRGGLGAEVNEFLDNHILNDVLKDLNPQGDGKHLQAVLLSGAGNDVVADNMRHILNPDNTGVTVAKDCFHRVNFQQRLDRIEQNYHDLLLHIRNAHPAIPVLLHCYDYAPPTGIGFLGFGQWMRAPMQESNIPQSMHLDVVHVLIDNLIAVMTRLQQSDANVFFVNSTDCLRSSNYWANELHPTAIGFTRLVEEKWRPVLQQAGLI